MIKKVIHLADIHIPNSTDRRPYDKMLDSALDQLENKVNELLESGIEREEIRIVVAGDLVHNKVKISNECLLMLHKFLNRLDELAQTIVIAGNHDMLENNTDRVDSLTPTFSIEGVYPNTTYADMFLDYKSGFIIDENVVWCLYSIFDGYVKPNTIGLDLDRNEYKFIGLYHGNVPGASTDTGRIIEDGIDMSWFDICDCVMAGHIHKHQEIKKGGVPLIMSSSLIQQNYGESITGHGFVLWDLETMTYEFCELKNDHLMFKFTIDSIDDIINGTEKLLNI